MATRKNLSDMSYASQRRHGYVDEKGNITEPGWRRMTKEDLREYDESNRLRRDDNEKANRGEK
ncbi:hypothetical protein [Paraburkholderia hospita]|uniref:hypothetical protein n=1 Tax=Paraburkholderia hospita TaxID=169430 RepID=UPI0009A64B04|nr:hypothetical protein [Paraburkholderia hospita]SKC49152.1 hypothetical protein SAMN05446934_0263 [Paraburkholderia hospita]